MQMLNCKFTDFNTFVIETWERKVLRKLFVLHHHQGSSLWSFLKSCWKRRRLKWSPSVRWVITTKTSNCGLKYVWCMIQVWETKLRHFAPEIPEVIQVTEAQEQFCSISSGNDPSSCWSGASNSCWAFSPIPRPGQFRFSWSITSIRGWLFRWKGVPVR